MAGLTANMQAKAKDYIKDQYTRSAADPMYFMKKFCKIQHPKLGKLPFELFSFQEQTLREFQNFDYNIILKARQLGLSTLVAGYILWMMMFQDDKSILIIAINQKVSINLVNKIKYMYNNLPSWLKVPDVEYNKLSLVFKNGSNVTASPSSETAGRSEALSLLVIDEAGFVQNADVLWAAAQQTLATGGQAILLSTPNGVGNFFHKMWIGAESDENDFNPIKLKWDVHPERNQAWRDKQTRAVGEQLASQENDVSFITSGYTVVDGAILDWYRTNLIKDPIEKQGIASNTWVWEFPDYTKSYILCADVARGDGKDYSTFHVLESESLTQAAEFKSKIGTTEFGHMLVNIATTYNDALLVVDSTGLGWSTVQVIIDRGYPNLLYTSNEHNFTDVQSNINKGVDLKRNELLKPGIQIGPRLRPLLISKLEEYFREKSPVVYSKRLIDELFTFIWDKGKAQARQGYNDDLTMAFALGLWARDTALRLKQEGLDMTKTTLNHIGKYNPVHNSVGKTFSEKQWSMNTAKGKESLDWLIR